eukprot:TRINITY_DN23855_c0_g1_i1.p1 TRINITY_DN23855_c0_g1~~TRINITY_DN23855_c0_g1_i1.p1  ORF type:complete len:476 (-),score=79.21 TRINITY_DN23855_c0_g1_i1:23-1450(-)
MSADADHGAKIAQLVEIASISDDEARKLLAAAEWNLETAVSLHFASVDSGATAATQASASGPHHAIQPSRSLVSQRRGPLDSDSDEEAPPATAQVEDTDSWFNSMYKAGSGFVQSVFGIASEDFETWFSGRFGAPVPRFCSTGFGDAVKQALDEQSLLLVWLHKNDDAATDALCRGVLQNPVVQRMLRRGTNLWAGDVSRFEPAHIASAFEVTDFPALILCQPLRDSPLGLGIEWPMGTFAQPVYRMTPPAPGEPLPVDTTVAALVSAGQDHHEAVQLQAEAAQRRAAQLAEERTLREQQDREFEESLLLDQLAEVKRLEEASGLTGVSVSHDPDKEERSNKGGTSVENGERSAVEASEGAVAQAEKDREEEEMKRKARGAEISASLEPVPAADGSTAKLSLKLPSGERLQRVFATSQRLSDVYEWAHCCRTAPKPHNFELCTTFPMKTLVDRSALLDTLGLAPSAALLMKSLDD